VRSQQTESRFSEMKKTLWEGSKNRANIRRVLSLPFFISREDNTKEIAEENWRAQEKHHRVSDSLASLEIRYSTRVLKLERIAKFSFKTKAWQTK